MEIRCKLLTTSVLDPVWSNVTLKLNKNDVQIFHDQPVFEGKKTKMQTIEKVVKTSTSVIQLANIVAVIQDPDTSTIRIDTKSNYFGTLGFYQLGFVKTGVKENSFDASASQNELNNNYKIVLDYLQLNLGSKNIEFSYRTKEQEKRFS